MSKGHATYSASESHRWMACPGSVELSREFPRYGSEAATNGTAAHHLGFMWMTGEFDKFTGGPPIGAKFKFMDGDEEKEAVVDAEMKDAVQVYVDFVLELLVDDPGSELKLEENVQLTDDAYGTADCVILGSDTLTVIDYKHGFTPVRIGSAGRVNTQLMFYACGALIKFDPDRKRFKFVQVGVVQPRCFEVDEVQTLTLSVAEVGHWFTEVFKPDYELARSEEGKSMLIPGDHCTWCPALSGCPEMAKKATEVARADFASLKRPVLPDVTALTDEQVANVLKWSPVLDGWIREVQERAFQELQSGKRIKGFKLVRKKSNRRWPDGMGAIELGRKLGCSPTDLMKEPELKSPAQAEKLGKKVKAMVAQVAEKPESGITMAADSDPRAAIGTDGTPQDDFKELEAEGLI